jgi:hypothetical protein
MGQPAAEEQMALRVSGGGRGVRRQGCHLGRVVGGWAGEGPDGARRRKRRRE